MTRSAMIRFLLVLVCALLTAVVASASSGRAHAARPEVIDVFTDWSAVVVEAAGSKVCYMVSEPVLREGDAARRGPAYAFVTHRPARNRYDVVTIMAGYRYEAGSDVAVEIGERRFDLFTADDAAWAADAALDRAIAEAIRRGRKMIVTGRSARGVETTDIYSLTGSNAAYEAISRACDR